MIKVRVLRNFKDLKENKNRKINEIFEATEERVEEINSTRYGTLVMKVVIGVDLSNGNDATVINGEVVDVEEDEVDTQDVEGNETDIESLTVAQIKELLDQMNIEYDNKMKKDDLIDLIKVGD